MTGEIRMYGGALAPTGWLFCQGQAVSRTTYAALYNIIGTTYGSGDGSTTFNLPNLQDRFPIGKSETKALGSTGGSATHTHTGPSHTHSYSLLSLEAEFSGLGGTQKNGSAETGHWGIVSTSGGLVRTTGASGTGNSGSTSTLPSYQTLNYIIKY